ncbi:hypothetical protein CC77DRAFT_1090589 [Alternaria alternata]|uniref:Uncharacterized protein n=1 Tax=Alternaria alternata TaxID=5599 RepID=A0A177DZ12_ALTAL|nr:hypothetical protein CC77DRAFT_1090589 [Alternaria alternata]OAG24965.1 hypothetical protein CC77DRAFT_1090589 [Alternaria alternata]RYN53578.1 hypothetical protein AA0118_g9603 [Alternaria tenuissima]
MVCPPLTEKQVYLALKDVFKGNEMLPSTLKKLRKRVEKSKENVNVKPLIQTYGIENITQVAKVLLDDQVFVLRTRAIARFPELIETLPSQLDQPSTTDTTIATSSASPPQRGGVYSPEELLGIGDKLWTRTKKERDETIDADCQTQSLDCVSLPLWDQHRLLVKIQYALEKACFVFAQKRLKDLLQTEKWDCAEAVELQRWAKVLFMYRKDLDIEDVKDVGKPLPILLDAITQLRNDAVHRIRLSSSGILQHMTNAGLLSQLVQDEECSKLITTIRMKTHDAIGKLVRNKQLLDDKMSKIKKDFAAKRAELERQETALLEAAVKEHEEPKISVSGDLDQVTDDLGGTGSTNAPWKHGCDPTLSEDKPASSADTVRMHTNASASKSNAQPAVTQVPNTAKDEVEMAWAEWRKAKEEKQAAKEQTNRKGGTVGEAIEDKEGTEEYRVSEKPGDGAVEDLHEDVEDVKQLSEPPIPVTTVDDGLIESAFTDEEEGDWKDKDEDSLEHYFECPEIVLDSGESDAKHPSNDPPLEQQVVATDTTSEERDVLDVAVASESCDSDLLEHDQGSIHEQYTSPAPTCVGQTEDNTDQGHTEPLLEEGISAGNGTMDLVASLEQPVATRGQSNAFTVIKSWGEGQWPGSVCIKSLDDDPRLELLPKANE